MSHHVAASLLLPTILQTKVPVSNGAGTASTIPSSPTTGTGLNNTFLNLLVKELQNQDPTSPLDSTAMVGQMISLNQLDQLISINQTITSGSTKAATTHAGPVINSTSGAAAVSAAAKAADANAGPVPNGGASNALGSIASQLSNLLPFGHGGLATAPIAYPVTGLNDSIPASQAPLMVDPSQWGISETSSIFGGK